LRGRIKSLSDSNIAYNRDNCQALAISSSETVLWQIAVDVPADPNVTELKCCGDAATHFEGTVALRWQWYQRSTL